VGGAIYLATSHTLSTGEFIWDPICPFMGQELSETMLSVLIRKVIIAPDGEWRFSGDIGMNCCEKIRLPQGKTSAAVTKVHGERRERDKISSFQNIHSQLP